MPTGSRRSAGRRGTCRGRSASTTTPRPPRGTGPPSSSWLRSSALHAPHRSWLHHGTQCPTLRCVIEPTPPVSPPRPRPGPCSSSPPSGPSWPRSTSRSSTRPSPTSRPPSPRASSASLSWVITVYSIVFGALLVVGGGRGDRLGRKRVFQGGIAGVPARVPPVRRGAWRHHPRRGPHPPGGGGRVPRPGLGGPADRGLPPGPPHAGRRPVGGHRRLAVATGRPSAPPSSPPAGGAGPSS